MENGDRTLFAKWPFISRFKSYTGNYVEFRRRTQAFTYVPSRTNIHTFNSYKNWHVIVIDTLLSYLGI